MRFTETTLWVRELHHDWRVACSCGRVGWVVADKHDPPDAVRFYLQRYQRDYRNRTVFQHLCYTPEQRKNVHVDELRP